MEFLLFGLVTGSVLLIGTVGFALVRNVNNFLNIAHAEYMTIGAYIALYLNTSLNWSIILAALAAIVLTAVLSLVIAKGVYEPIRRYGPTTLLITSVGVAFGLHGILAGIAGPKASAYKIPLSQVLSIGGMPTLTSEEFVVIVIGVASAIFLHLFLNYTKTGKTMRAMANDFDLARVRGIDSNRVNTYVWLISGASAGLGGVLLGLVGRVVYPDLGWSQILIVLCVAILAGARNLYGVIVSAFLIGISMDLSVLVFPSKYRVVVAFVVIILAVLFRPNGIMEGKTR